jgi:hypothetical protein
VGQMLRTPAKALQRSKCTVEYERRIIAAHFEIVTARNWPTAADPLRPLTNDRLGDVKL